MCMCAARTSGRTDVQRNERRSHGWTEFWTLRRSEGPTNDATYSASCQLLSITAMRGVVNPSKTMHSSVSIVDDRWALTICKTFEHHLKIVWASLDIIGHHLFVTWILFGHYFDSIWISFGLHLEFVWPSFGRDWNPNCKNKGSELQTFLKSDGWNTKSNSMRKLFQDHHRSNVNARSRSAKIRPRSKVRNSKLDHSATIPAVLFGARLVRVYRT